MRVFIDPVSGDEFFSDSFPHTLIFDGTTIEAKAKYVTKGADNFQIAPDGDESAGEDGEGETVIDIVDKFELKEIGGQSKKEFMQWAKLYFGKVTQKLKDQDEADKVPAFKAGATALVKHIVGKFDEFQFFLGSKNDFEGAMCFAYQKEQEDEGPTFLFIKDGLKETKF